VIEREKFVKVVVIRITSLRSRRGKADVLILTEGSSPGCVWERECQCKVWSPYATKLERAETYGRD